jgi:hypothetical protein
MNAYADQNEAAVDTLVRTAFRHRIVEPNFESGFARFSKLTEDTLTASEFQAAVAYCLARRLIRDPVRLVEGALQCHWHLELTPAGVDAARVLSAQTRRASE